MLEVDFFSVGIVDVDRVVLGLKEEGVFRRRCGLPGFRRCWCPGLMGLKLFEFPAVADFCVFRKSFIRIRFRTGTRLTVATGDTAPAVGVVVDVVGGGIVVVVEESGRGFRIF